MKKSACKPGSV